MFYLMYATFFLYSFHLQIKREISIKKLIIHPNVICLYEASKGRLKEDEARKYFQQLISRGVYHRDLK
ncbi:hypothetical protein ES332_A05G458100v1 [Gossypium tomentosum]|nr:hypothetical protein ES332_A05G458100v1 [Gossypium tomentosum]